MVKRLHRRIAVIQTIASAARYFRWWAWVTIFGVAVSVGAWLAVMM